MENQQVKSPQPQQTNSLVNPQPIKKPTNKGLKWGWVILVIAILLLIGSIATAWYLFYFDDSQIEIPFAPASPEKNIREMIVAMRDVKTYQSDIKSEIIVLPAAFKMQYAFDPETAKITMDMKTDYDNSDKDNPKTNIIADFTIEPPDGDKLSLSAEIRSIGEDIYVRVIKMPAEFEEELSEVSAILDFFYNWIKFEVPAGYMGMDEIEQIQNLISNDLRIDLNDQQEQQLQNFIDKGEYFKVEKVFDETTINDVEVYHYLTVIDQELLINKIKEILDSGKDTTNSIREKYQQKKFANFSENMEKLVAMIDKIEVELWIGKQDKLAHQYDLYMFFQDPESESKASLDLKSTNYNFNQPLSIKEPAEYKTIPEIMQEIYNASRQQYQQSLKPIELDQL